MRYVIHFALSIALLVSGIGCAAEQGPPVSAGDPAGSLRFPLQHQGADGSTYYLRGALLLLGGQVDMSIPAGEGAVLQQPLPQGQYTVDLLAGWWMERDSAGLLETVEAELVSPNPLPFSISTGETTDIVLRFRIEADDELSFETGQLAVDMQVASGADGGVASGDAGPGCEGLLVINEVDYDQPGADESEFIELYNPTGCPVSTQGLTLELINGANQEAAVYASVDLSAAGDSIRAGGYLVAGASQVVEALAESTASVTLSASIQNGDPDGVRLRDGEAVMDALSYGGAIPEVTEAGPAPADTESGSIARCENGKDTDDNSADFFFTQAVTPGAANYCTFLP